MAQDTITRKSQKAPFLRIDELPSGFLCPRNQVSVTSLRIEKYFDYTKRGLAEAKKALNSEKKKEALDFLDMASRYYSDAQHFFEKGDLVTAFAALNYAHGWLDAGARIGLFEVHNSELFTVD